MSHRPAKQIDLCEVLRSTDLALDRMDRARMLIEDPRESDRLAAQECRPCFYSSKAGGAACSSSDCGGCGATVRSGSTNVPRLCKDCARKLRLCRHCGADINLRNRRKLDLSGLKRNGIAPQEGGDA